MTDVRTNLERLIVENGDDMVSISRMLGRNSAYIQQFIRRGTPRKLDEDDRRTLAKYFGCDETLLGGLEAGDTGPPVAFVPKLDIGASAGPGGLVDNERAHAHVGFETQWLRRLVPNPGNLSIIQVAGDSMSPTLLNGDDILVDRGAWNKRPSNGVYVIRLNDALLVKRLLVRSGRDVATVKSDNPEHPTLLDQPLSSIEIVGRVVWVGRKLR